jgi:hypothetical protein
MFPNVPSYRSGRLDGSAVPGRYAPLNVVLLFFPLDTLRVANLSICRGKHFHNPTDCGSITSPI